MASQFVSIGLVLLLVAGADMLSWHVLWLPIVVLLQVMWLAGITWILSSLTVALPDVTYFVNLFVFLLMWVTPIGFKPEMVPAGFRFVLYLNPIFYMTEVYRDSMLNGRFPSATVAAVYVVMCLATFALGQRLLRALQGRADGLRVRSRFPSGRPEGLRYDRLAVVVQALRPACGGVHHVRD